jgi:hypothetical protein
MLPKERALFVKTAKQCTWTSRQERKDITQAIQTLILSNNGYTYYDVMSSEEKRGMTHLLDANLAKLKITGLGPTYSLTNREI